MEMFETSKGRHMPDSRSVRLGIFAANALLVASGLFGCGDADEKNKNFVDCQKYPQGSVSTTIDTLGQSSQDIGNAKAEPGGEPVWREKITVAGNNNARFTVVASNGSALTIPWEIVAAEPSGTRFIGANISTGSTLTGSVPEQKDNDTLTVTVTFHC